MSTACRALGGLRRTRVRELDRWRVCAAHPEVGGRSKVTLERAPGPWSTAPDLGGLAPDLGTPPISHLERLAST